MGSHLVEPGAVLADRYLIEDLLAEEGESNSWRARDKILSRSVVLHIITSSSPRANDLLDAAKRASRVADPRLLQVLDAVDDGELAYVVREWASGQSLDVVLAEGPLPARRAAWLVREVAAAMTQAHRCELPHRRLAPDTVVITKSSGVKVVGLATFAALRDHDAENDGVRQDTADLGRLLYACLTARWPGGAVSGLPAAPTEHGRLLRPRQVRAGVPRALDLLCERILNETPRYGEPITTVAEVEESLSQILSDDGVTTSTGLEVVARTPQPGRSSDVEPHPALLPRDAGTRDGEQPRDPSDPDDSHARSPLGRTLLLTVVAMLVAGVVLLAYLVGQRGVDTPTSQDDTRSDSPDKPVTRPLQIAAAVSFDPPPGTGDENPDLVPRAYDGKPGTAWETLRYDGDPALGGLKPGVGIVLELGQVMVVRGVDVTLPSAGTNLQIRTAPQDAETSPAAGLDDYAVQETLTSARNTTRVTFAKPVRTQFVLVWLTRLPPEGSGSYRGLISEVQVLG